PPSPTTPPLVTWCRRSPRGTPSLVMSSSVRSCRVRPCRSPTSRGDVMLQEFHFDNAVLGEATHVYHARLGSILSPDAQVELGLMGDCVLPIKLVATTDVYGPELDLVDALCALVREDTDPDNEVLNALKEQISAKLATYL